MKLSTKGRYSVRAMVSLGILSKLQAGPVSLKDISRVEGISVSYLEQLFVHLRRSGLVKSVRGPGGGYLFARDPEAIFLDEIMAVVKESINPVDCRNCEYYDEAACASGYSRNACCVTRPMWEELDEKISSYLHSISLANLLSGQKGV
ncbi:MAG: Rrf2 family transcriptional regulator [Deltaproteobacteria bacterium]|nr:Rrf2 family transcriptional regulator [Deltaproteobacteria bacterium]